MKHWKMPRKYWNSSTILFVLFLCFGCAEPAPKFDIIGPRIIESGDTIFHQVRQFQLVNQDSLAMSPKSYLGNTDNYYIADFFFTRCPSICPTVARQMKRIHDAFLDDKRITLISFTMDPDNDTPEVLKSYGEKLDVNFDKWQFLTGHQDSLLDIADEHFVAALIDDDAPGGYDHSGKIVFVDNERHVRHYCEGTDEDSVTKFIKDVKKYLSQK